MDKNVSISIRGVVFQIEEKAFKRLSVYLESIRAYFDKTEDSDEIVADIEDRIGENLASKINRHKEVVTLGDVEAVIKQMGTIEDFAETDEKSEAGTSRPKGTKRLYRHPDDQMIAGVASGLAAYFDTDPTLMRIIFVITLFFGGFGIILYLILWITMPEANSVADRLEMEGENVTLKKIEETIKTKFNDLKKNSKFEKKIKSASRSVSKTFRRSTNKVGPFFAKLIGAVLAIIATVVAAAFTVVLAVVIFNIDSPLLNSPIVEFISANYIYILAISGWVVLLLPFLIILLIGLSLFFRRQLLSWSLATGVFITWLIAVMVFGIFAFKALPDFRNGVIERHDNVVTRTYELEDFDRIELNGTHRIEITQGEEFEIIVEAEEDDLRWIEPVVRNGELQVANREQWQLCFFCNARSAYLRVTMPDLAGLQLDGASRAEIAGFKGVEQLEVELNSAARADLEEIVITDLKVDLNGAARMNIEGSGDELELEANGASKFEGRDYLVKAATIETNGASRVEIQISEILHAVTNAVSRIKYWGEPEVTSESNGNSGIDRAGIVDLDN